MCAVTSNVGSCAGATKLGVVSMSSSCGFGGGGGGWRGGVENEVSDGLLEHCEGEEICEGKERPMAA